MPDPESSSQDLNGLDPAGVMRGALDGGSASWPAEGPVAWVPPEAEEVAALFPGFAEVSFINRGGMGAVYAARQVTLDRRVALKLLPVELSRDPSAAERFRREARALARLSHPNIVGIHDFGETQDGSFFFVMEYVEGADLHRLIRGGQLPLSKALDVVRQVCDALEFAHAQGFVHRDIKPSNILVDAHGRVKVSDFGLAKLVSENPEAATGAPSPTMTQSVVGTPEYVAPEQRRGDRLVDHRADIYSLGVMLYEMLTGSVPYGVFEPPSRRAGTVEALDRVVERAMQEEPDKRYQHAADVKSEVNKAASPASRNRWFQIAAAVALVAGAVWIWTTRNGDKSEEGSLRARMEASADKPFSNSLGISFLPTGRTPGVLMAVGETRRRDFEAFVVAKSYMTEGDVMVPRGDGWEPEPGSWQTPPGLPAQSPDHPVVAVDQDDAEAFCSWLTSQERAAGRLGARERYRLPTIDEWLAATGHKGSLEDYQTDLSASVILSPAREGPAPVVMTPDSIRDLDSNVAEWTSTTGPRSQQRLVCGRSWAEAVPAGNDTLPVRSYPRNLRGVAMGFRLVLDRRMAP